MQRCSWDAIKPPVMQPDLFVPAEITFSVLIALQYLGYIVANMKNKSQSNHFQDHLPTLQLLYDYKDANKSIYMSYITQTTTINWT